MLRHIKNQELGNSEQCGGITERLQQKKNASAFFDSRLIEQFRAVVVRGTSVHPSLPHFCFAKIRSRFAKVRHGIPAVHCMKRSFPRHLQRARSAKFPAQQSSAPPIKKCFSAVFSHALFCRNRASRSAYRPSSVLYISSSCLRVFRKTLRPCFLQRR